MLLAVFLAARFRKPWTIILGIFVATFLNHVIAGALGATLANFISADLLRWILIVSFIAMGSGFLFRTRSMKAAMMIACGDSVFSARR